MHRSLLVIACVLSSQALSQVPQADFTLKDGTPVRLKLTRNLSSADATVGETVDFEVLEEVKLGETIVIPKGGTALGTVTEAQPKRRMARGGKLNVNIDYVRLVNSEKAALRGIKETKGGGHAGAMTGAIVATSIVFFPAAPFFLFMHGKDINIPKGTEITAYINGDARIAPEKLKAAPATPAFAPTATTDPPARAFLKIASTPPGADIELNGKFSGNTPSDLVVDAGSYSISIKKTGFTAWSREIQVASGATVTLSAELEKVHAQP